MSGKLRFVSTGLTHQGCVRTRNEDSHHIDADGGLWLVADGMGGYENGQWASSTVVEALDAVALDAEFETNVERLRDALLVANETIAHAADEQGVRMGSTVAALCIKDQKFACVWAGDSRIYLLRDGELSQITRDHTQVQELIDRNTLTPEEARGHPMSHVITRAVGVGHELEPEILWDDLELGDAFLICSDGLSGLVTDDEIERHLSVLGPAAACQALLNLALERGAPDNVTVVTVSCEETTALILPSAS